MKPLTIMVMFVVLIAAAKVAAASKMFEGHGRKVEFDDSVGMASENAVYDDDEEEDEKEDEDMFGDVTMADLENLRWTGVTREGYEFEGTLAEVEEMLSDPEADNDSDDLDEEESDEEDRDYFEGEDNDDDVPLSHTFQIISHGDQKANVEKNSICRHGSESRKMANTKRYPYNSIGQTLKGCSGVFISKRHFLTAGHCVYNRVKKRWYKDVDVLRGKSCNPHKGLQRHTWVNCLAASGYTKRGKRSYDYGMIIVKQKSPRRMSYGYKTSLLGKTIYMAGYPFDKYPRRDCMWRQSCKVRAGTTSKQFRYRCDTASGQSGGPIWVYRKRKRTVYGVHTSCHGRTSRGARINRKRFKSIKKWIKNT